MTTRETAQGKRDRQNREDYAAIRAAITDADRAAVREADPGTEWPAGERLTLTAGTRRTIKVDHGRVLQVAHGDALAALPDAAGYWISHTMTFGIGTGRGTVYAVERHARRVA